MMVSCLACGGTGDLDGYRLWLAYEAGRMEVLSWLESAGLQSKRPALSVDELKLRVAPAREAA